PIAGNDVADRSGRDGEYSARAERLQRTREKKHPIVRGRDGDDASYREKCDAPEIDRAPSVTIRKRARDRDRDDGDEQIQRKDPCQVARLNAQVATDCR